MQRYFELHHLEGDGQYKISYSGFLLEDFVFEGSSHVAASLLEVLMRLGSAPYTKVEHSHVHAQWRSTATDAPRLKSAIYSVFKNSKPNIITQLRDLKLIRVHESGRNKSYELAPTVIWRHRCNLKGCSSRSMVKDDSLSDLLSAIEFSHFNDDQLQGSDASAIAFPLCLRSALMSMIARNFERYEKIKKYKPYRDGLKKVDEEFPVERNYYQIILAWEKYDKNEVTEAEAKLDAIYRSGITSMGSLLQASYHLLKAYILRRRMLACKSKPQVSELLNLAFVEAKRAYSHSLLVDNLVLIMESIWIVTNLLMYFKIRQVDFKGDLGLQLTQFRILERKFWDKFKDSLPSTYVPIRAAEIALYASKIDQQHQAALDHLRDILKPNGQTNHSQKFDLTCCYVEGFRASLALDLANNVYAKNKGQLNDEARDGMPSTKQFYDNAVEEAQRNRRSGKPHKLSSDQIRDVESLLQKYLDASAKHLSAA